MKKGLFDSIELYVVTDRKSAGKRPLENIVESAIRGGAGIIQYREKEFSDREYIEQAKSIQSVCKKYGVPFIINDRVHVAWLIGAAGVHLGRNDFPPKDARRLLGKDKIVGCSTHSVDEALDAIDEGIAGYINIGPIFATKTKNDACNPVGLETLCQVLKALPSEHPPLTTMGGINQTNVAEVINAGADRVAVVSAVIGAPDPEAAAREMIKRIREAKGRRD